MATDAQEHDDKRQTEAEQDFTGNPIAQAIRSGIVFKGKGKSATNASNGKSVKTKAKKKGYITGSHGSASAQKKANIRQRRANRHKNNK